MKLYIVVDRALSAGMKAAQACHAMAAWHLCHPEWTREWMNASNTLVVLQHPELPTLDALLAERGLARVRVEEPDLDGRLTALCVEPGARKALAGLELAG
jgi:peptidyl-tRNA hydrolase